MTYHPAPRAFTLVETMVAIAILAVALVGPFMAVQSALSASYVARDQLIASSLAQEGLEYVRSVRDNNYLNGRAWMHFPYSCLAANPTYYCTVDPSQGDFHTASQAVDVYSQLSYVPYLSVSDSNLYNQQGQGPVSRFKRYVQIRSTSATEVLITVTVEWKSSQRTYTVVVTDVLRDWL